LSRLRSVVFFGKFAALGTAGDSDQDCCVLAYMLHLYIYHSTRGRGVTPMLERRNPSPCDVVDVHVLHVDVCD